jgi:hypothetical protein
MLGWFQQLDKASHVAEVVDIARDYLATWTPEEVALLPRTCRPGRVRDPADIEEMHACAVDAYRGTRASGEELKALQLLTSFLVRASMRLVQLRASGGDDPPPEPPGATIPPKRLAKARDY